MVLIHTYVRTRSLLPVVLANRLQQSSLSSLSHVPGVVEASARLILQHCRCRPGSVAALPVLVQQQYTAVASVSTSHEYAYGAGFSQHLSRVCIRNRLLTGAALIWLLGSLNRGAAALN